MSKFFITLHRDYEIAISAENAEDAKELAEYYIGGEKDLSDEKDRKEHSFRIEEIEIKTNDAFEVKESHE
jgi:hypothetical protein